MTCYIVASGASQVYHYSFSVNAHNASHAYCVGQYISLQEISGSQIRANMQSLDVIFRRKAWMCSKELPREKLPWIMLALLLKTVYFIESCEVIAFQYQPTDRTKTAHQRKFLFITPEPLSGLYRPSILSAICRVFNLFLSTSAHADVLILYFLATPIDQQGHTRFAISRKSSNS